MAKEAKGVISISWVLGVAWRWQGGWGGLVGGDVYDRGLNLLTTYGWKLMEEREVRR